MNILAEKRGVFAKDAMPQTEAQNDGPWPLRAVFFVRKVATQHRMNSQDIKIAGGDAAGVNVFDVLASLKIDS